MNMVKNIVLKFELSVQIHITHREILDTRLWRVNLQNNDSDIYLDLSQVSKYVLLSGHD